MIDANEPAAQFLTSCGIELETVRAGKGRPIVLLHGFQNFDRQARVIGLLARHGEIIAPSHPGFGGSPRPDGFETVYDLVHLYLGLIDALPREPVTLIGCSFGGWLAAEVAAASCHRLDRLILVDALGLKVSGRETADIVDIFNTSPAEVRRLSWHDAAAAPDLDSMSDAALVQRARNWDALCLYGWHPYMHNRRLNPWLQRIAVPTLVLWGAGDGIVTPDYGRAMSALIPGARFQLVERAGHHPELERPDAVVDAVAGFLER